MWLQLEFLACSPCYLLIFSKYFLFFPVIKRRILLVSCSNHKGQRCACIWVLRSAGKGCLGTSVGVEQWLHKTLGRFRSPFICIENDYDSINSAGVTPHLHGCERRIWSSYLAVIAKADPYFLFCFACLLQERFGASAVRSKMAGFICSGATNKSRNKGTDRFLFLLPVSAGTSMSTRDYTFPIIHVCLAYIRVQCHLNLHFQQELSLSLFSLMIAGCSRERNVSLSVHDPILSIF